MYSTLCGNDSLACKDCVASAVALILPLHVHVLCPIAMSQGGDLQLHVQVPRTFSIPASVAL